MTGPLDDLAGTGNREVRLFPLPSVVVYPHVVQPLHIFEPRYRELLEDALADDQTFAMSVPMPGWQAC